MRAGTSKRGFMIGGMNSLVVLLLGLHSTISEADDDRHFTVDDLLMIEGLCHVSFDPAGERLLFEWVAGYDQGNSYVEPWPDLGWNRSQIYTVELDRSPGPRRLFEKVPGQSYWFGALAPNGSKVTVYHRSASGDVGGGIFDFERTEFLPFRSAPELRAFFGPDHVWLTETKLVYAAQAFGRRPLDSASRVRDELPKYWRLARKGDTTTVSVLRSGQTAHAELSPVTGSLILLDTDARTESILAAGIFLELQASPDGNFVAAIERGEPLRPSARSSLSHTALKYRSPLALIPTESNGEPFTVCVECDVFPGSLRWSADGNQILFYARNSAENWSVARYYRYDLPTQSLAPILPDTLEPVRSRNYVSPPAKAEWVGQAAVLYARPDSLAGKTARADWYLVDTEGSTVNMTASLPLPPTELAALSGGEAYFVSDGDVWRISANGTRANLTEDIDAPLELWQPSAASGCGTGHVLTAPRLMLRDRGTPASVFVSLELATDRRRALRAPSPGAELVAVSGDSRTAVFSEQLSGAANRLTLMMADETAIPLLETNAHMADIARPKYVRIGSAPEKEPDADGWLLLPPGHRPGDRHPLIVHIYPGFVRSAKPGWSLHQPHPLNPHLLAGQGYAVLFPNIALTPEGKPGNPMTGLAERIMPVIDRVIEDGYVDPDRMGLFGHSYGAYGVLGILSQTIRFRAAVAANGISNLLGNYGTFDIRSRIDAPAALRLFAASWSESGQGRMGVPPWRDPQRYLRNSPLIYAEEIETPVMLVHGDLDYVSMAQSEQMFTALHRLNKEAVFLRYWGEGHVLASPANIRDFWKRVFAWYDRYLTTPGDRRTQRDPDPRLRTHSDARSEAAEPR